MARGDLALGAGLTAVFPVLSSVLTPMVCWVAAPFLPSVGPLRFALVPMMVTLLATAPLPLVLGLVVRARFPGIAARIVPPVDVVAQAVGAVSLAYVVVVEADGVLAVGLPGLLAMGVVAEISWILGWLGDRGTPRRGLVLGLGALNRNMALALLVAAGSFPGSRIVAGVASLGLLLITLGLVHVGIWRWIHRAGTPAPDGRP